jgi:hypothetical protein
MRFNVPAIFALFVTSIKEVVVGSNSIFVVEPVSRVRLSSDMVPIEFPGVSEAPLAIVSSPPIGPVPFTAAEDATDIAPGNEPFTARVPPDTDIVPSKVFVAERVTVPVPVFVKEASEVPAITPSIVRSLSDPKVKVLAPKFTVVPEII